MTLFVLSLLPTLIWHLGLNQRLQGFTLADYAAETTVDDQSQASSAEEPIILEGKSLIPFALLRFELSIKQIKMESVQSIVRASLSQFI